MEPPRGRGKDSGTVHGCGQLRITPAWAGKSSARELLLIVSRDHPRAGREKQTGTVYAVLPYGSPRAGGEKNKELEGVWLPMGPPPRGRGKANSPIVSMMFWGITPAQAGKSCFSYFLESSVWDHPRIGGEKPITLMISHRKGGSPPHRRGKVLVNLILTKGHRITPAWAGKSKRPET